MHIRWATKNSFTSRGYLKDVLLTALIALHLHFHPKIGTSTTQKPKTQEEKLDLFKEQNV
jgi:hypothetical protein